MKKTILLIALLAIATSGMAQDNHSYGAGDGDFKSLSEEVAKLKKRLSGRLVGTTHKSLKV